MPILIGSLFAGYSFAEQLSTRQITMELIPTQIGAYRLDNEIGRGQTVVVFRAYDTLYERTVALKVFPPYHQDNDPQTIRSFISDGREAMRLRHPNIVETFDSGVADGFHYIAQELAAHSLESVLAKQQEEIPIEASLELLSQIGEALDYAHQLEIVHGALRPPNILLTADGRPLLTNFDFEGRRRGAVQNDLTSAKLIDLAYLAPEQAQGSPQSDSRSDIYALGILAYRLLVGELPYQGDNVLSLLHNINNGIPYVPSSRQKELPATMDAVLLQALERTPSHRWATGAGFAATLEKASTGEAVSVPLHTATPTEETASVEMPLSDPNGPLADPDGSLADPDNREADFLFPAPVVISQAATQTNLQPVVQMEDLPTIPTSAEGPQVVLQAQGNIHNAEASTQQSPRGANWAGVLVGITAILLLIMVGLTLSGRLQWETILTDDSTPPTEGQLELVLPVHDQGIAEEQAAVADESQVDETSEVQEIESTGAEEEQAEQPPMEDAPELVASDDENRTALEDDQIKVAVLLPTNTVPPVPADTATAQPTNTPTDEPTNTPTDLPTETPTSTSTPPPTPTVAATATQEPQSEVVLASTEGDSEFVPLENAQPPIENGPNAAAVSESPISDVGSGLDDAVTQDDGTASDVDAALDEDAVPAELFGRIAYAIWNPRSLAMDTYIYVIGSGVSPMPLVNRRQPDFRSDGWLAFNSEGGGLENIMRTQSTGQNGVIISAHPEDSRPHWAPSGKQFVFDSTLMGDRRHRIYISNDIDETENEVAQELKPIMYDFWEILGRHPIFLGDGQIAYQGCNVWENGGSCGIYRINGVGSKPQRVTAWPNDIPTDNMGTSVLFMSDRGTDSGADNWDVYRVNADGSNPLRLTEHPAHDGLATASPDGQHIAFVSDRDGVWAVYVMGKQGENVRKIFELNGQFGPGPQYWQYDWKQERLSWGY